MPQKPLQVVRGETPIDPPASVWKQYNCATRQLPYVVIESDYLDSPIINPGQQLGHNLVYAMCSRDNKSIQGNMQRKIYYRGKLLSRKSKEFELKPGRWSVGSIIEVPKSAKPGSYNLITEFNSRIYSNQMSDKGFSVEK